MKTVNDAYTATTRNARRIAKTAEFIPTIGLLQCPLCPLARSGHKELARHLYAAHFETVAEIDG